MDTNSNRFRGTKGLMPTTYLEKTPTDPDFIAYSKGAWCMVTFKQAIYIIIALICWSLAFDDLRKSSHYDPATDSTNREAIQTLIWIMFTITAISFMISYFFRSNSNFCIVDSCVTPDHFLRHLLTYTLAIFMTYNGWNSDVNDETYMKTYVIAIVGLFYVELSQSLQAGFLGHFIKIISPAEQSN